VDLGICPYFHFVLIYPLAGRQHKDTVEEIDRKLLERIETNHEDKFNSIWKNLL